MSTAPGDSPDFQAFAQAASGNIFPQFNVSLAPGTHTFGPMPVTSWSSMVLNLTASQGNAIVNVQHFADAAGAQLIGTDGWPVTAAEKLFVITPLRGAYVSVVVTVVLAENWVATMHGQFRSDGAQHITFPVGYQFCGANARTVPASGDDFYTPLSICAGRGSFKFVPYDTAGKLHVRIYVQTAAGVFQFYIADFGFPAVPIYQLVEIPDDFIVVEILNTDAAAGHEYDVELIIPPQ